MAVIRITEWRARRERRRQQVAWEARQAEQERLTRERSDRLERILRGDWPPFGGDAA